MREGGSISCESCHFRTARASGSLANCDSALTCLQLQNKPLVSAAGKVNGFRIQPLLLQKIPFVSKTYRRSRRSENGYPKLRSEPVEPSVRPNPLWQRDSSSTCFFSLSRSPIHKDCRGCAVAVCEKGFGWVKNVYQYKPASSSPPLCLPDHER